MAVKTWLGWSLAVAGVLAVGPLVLGRGQPARLTSLDEISRMSELERESLKRKYEQYRALTEQQRSDLRALHQQIEDDRVNGARDLATMNDYCDWLKTIDAWQQDELAHKTDPQQKAKRVAEIVMERKQRELDAEARQDGERPLIGNGPLILTEEQLTRVFDVLAERLTNLTDEERQQINSQRGLKRFGLQVRYLRQTISNPEAFFQTISDAELTKMVEASGNSDLVQILKSGPGDLPLRKRLITFSIFASCRNQLAQDSAQLPESELQAFFSQLPPEEQDQLLLLRADEFNSQLRLKRLESDPDISELKHLMGKQFSAAMRRMERLRKEGGFLGPMGPGGPPFDRQGGPDGGRDPNDRRRDGGRGNMQRPFRGGQFGNGPPSRPNDEEGRPDPPPEEFEGDAPRQPPPQ